MKWNDDLKDQNSEAFKELSRVFKEEVKTGHSKFFYKEENP